MRTEIIGDATLYQGDCRDILPGLEKVQTVVMDPPYGINLAYDQYEDTESNLKQLGPAVLELCLNLATVVSLSPGNLNQYLYKKTDVDLVLVQSGWKWNWSLGIFMLATYYVLRS